MVGAKVIRNNVRVSLSGVSSLGSPTLFLRPPQGIFQAKHKDLLGGSWCLSSALFTGCCGIYSWETSTFSPLQTATTGKLVEENPYFQWGGRVFSGEETLLSQEAEPQPDTCKELGRGTARDK